MVTGCTAGAGPIRRRGSVSDGAVHCVAVRPGAGGSPIPQARPRHGGQAEAPRPDARRRFPKAIHVPLQVPDTMTDIKIDSPELGDVSSCATASAPCPTGRCPACSSATSRRCCRIPRPCACWWTSSCTATWMPGSTWSAGIDARGFILGAIVAYELNLGFVPIRKKGSCPTRPWRRNELEYGSATVEIHADACKRGDRVLLIDDLIATGGTMMAGRSCWSAWAAWWWRGGHRRPARAGRLAPAARRRPAVVHGVRLRRPLIQPARGRCPARRIATAPDRSADRPCRSHSPCLTCCSS